MKMGDVLGLDEGESRRRTDGVEIAGRGKQKAKWQERWEDSKGMLLILCSELFGAGMAAAARLLEMGDGGMMTLHIMLARSNITFFLSSLYMLYTAVPDFAFGKPEVGRLLVLRGLGGTVGVFGFNYSLQYLPIAEAILLTFITPIFTAYACSIFLRAPFEKKQLVAGLISFLGVILIVQPGPLSKLSGSHEPTPRMPEEALATTAQRFSAVLVGLLGILGAVCAYTIIRVIGLCAHPFLSVNYYGFITTSFSGLALLLSIFPDLTFRLPHGYREWGLLIGLGIFGFFLQFLMTAGLVKDKSSRAINMMYSSVVFSLGLNYAIWGAVPGWTSWAGGAIGVAAALWGAIQSGDVGVQKMEARRDEEYAMVPGEELVSDDEDYGKDGQDENETRNELQRYDTINMSDERKYGKEEFGI